MARVHAGAVIETTTKADGMEAQRMNADESDGRVAQSVAIVVNGETVDVDADATVADLVAARALTGKRIAVERNGEIVPRSRHASTTLAAGDRLEIVVAVGGG